MISPDTWTRRCAVTLSRFAAHILQPIRSETATAMTSEISYIERDLPALTWAMGCLSSACMERARSTLPALLRIGRSAPLLLWHVGSMLCFAWLGLLSLFGLFAKMLDPNRVGLWLDLPLNAPHRYESASSGLMPIRVGHDHIVFGLPYDGTMATEALGLWFLPLMTGLLLLAAWLFHRSLSAAMRTARFG
jgi:hypothetical protein